VTPNVPKAGNITCGVIIRDAAERDLTQLVRLIGEHQQYERAVPHPIDATALGRSLLGAGRSGRCIVAVDTNVVDTNVVGTDPFPHRGDEVMFDEVLVGYSSMSLEFATWKPGHYLHMDTLFVSESHRGAGLGRQLFSSVVQIAERLGVSEVQWQTPDWNVNAHRFYDRVGGVAKPKSRYSLPITPSTVGNAAVLEAFTSAWVARDESALRSSLHPDARYAPSAGHDGVTYVGIDAVLGAIRSMWTHDDGAVATFGPALHTLDTITRTWTYHFPDGDPQHGIDVFTFSDGLVTQSRRLSSELMVRFGNTDVVDAPLVTAGSKLDLGRSG
jgi:ribosomal protein S18 acetylase RimI-like enzyme